MNMNRLIVAIRAAAWIGLSMLNLSVFSSSAFAGVYLEGGLGPNKARAVISLKDYFAGLCDDCVSGTLPRALTGVKDFPADGMQKIKNGLAQLGKMAEKTPNYTGLVERLEEYLGKLKVALDSHGGVSEVVLLDTIIKNKDLFSKEMIAKVTELSLDSLALESRVRIGLMQKTSRVPPWQDVMAALCAEEPEKVLCQTKHEALLLLNRFFTEIVEQLGSGIKFCENEGACSAMKNSLYVAMVGRLGQLLSWLGIRSL